MSGEAEAKTEQPTAAAEGEDPASEKKTKKAPKKKAATDGLEVSPRNPTKKASTQMKPSINCQCGAVKVELKSKKALFRLECCCYDCSAALKYANTNKQGPKQPEHQAIDSVFFPNNFSIVKGKAKIGAFKNFEAGDTTRFHCVDCWTLLFSDFPTFEGKLMMTQANCYQDFKGIQNIEIMDVCARHNTKDVDADELAAMPAFAGDPANVYEGIAKNYLDAQEELLAAGNAGEEMNMQILLAKIGPAAVPTDGPLLTMGPPTLISQMPEDKKQRISEKAAFTPPAREVSVAKPPPVQKTAPTSGSKPKTQLSAMKLNQRSVAPGNALAQSNGQKKDKDKKEAKSKQAIKDETERLKSALATISGPKGKGSISSKDVEQLLKSAGGRAEKTGIDELMQELGSNVTGNVSEALFMEKASAYFNTCDPSAECTEIWQLVGGKLAGESTLKAVELGDALARIGCELSRDEVEDLVAFSTYGNDKIGYDDFVRTLFP